AELNLERVVVRIPAGVDVQDLAKLWIRPEEIGREPFRDDVCAIDPLHHVRKRISQKIGLACARVDPAGSREEGVENPNRLAGPSGRTAGAIRVATFSEVRLRQDE